MVRPQWAHPVGPRDRRRDGLHRIARDPCTKHALPAEETLFLDRPRTLSSRFVVTASPPMNAPSFPDPSAANAEALVARISRNVEQVMRGQHHTVRQLLAALAFTNNEHVTTMNRRLPRIR
jgi:hypothetical protein